MILQDLRFHLGERRFYRLQLMENIHAVPVILDHLREPAHLPRDSVQPIDFCGLCVSHGPSVRLSYPMGVYIAGIDESIFCKAPQCPRFPDDI